MKEGAYCLSSCDDAPPNELPPPELLACDLSCSSRAFLIFMYGQSHADIDKGGRFTCAKSSSSIFVL
jgi:hypothetical protein